MNHDYFALRHHRARGAELQADAGQDRLVRQVLRARRVRAQLTAPTTVAPAPWPQQTATGARADDDREAA